MKPVPQYQATVEKQHPATDGVANLIVVGIVRGTHDQCWKEAKKLTKFPVMEFRNVETH